MGKAIILDRDGTLVNNSGYYLYKLEDFKLLPGVVEGLKMLSKEFIFVVITNQAGIGLGIYTEKDMHKFNGKLANELKSEGIDIKKIYYCRHTIDEGCDCRKPSTKHIEKAVKEFNIDKKKIMGHRGQST